MFLYLIDKILNLIEMNVFIFIFGTRLGASLGLPEIVQIMSKFKGFIYILLKISLAKLIYDITVDTFTKQKQQS